MKRFGLIGKSLGHSFSATYFNGRFQRENLRDHLYELYPLERIESFPELLRATPDLYGLNVTIPYKESIIPFLDELDPTAQAIGAVNTIQFVNGKTKGFNTDAHGFKASIRPFLENKHERALILGTGGAAKAVAHVLEELGVTVYFASRSPETQNSFFYKDINEPIMNACLLIVNCTPLGTYPDVEDMPGIPSNLIGSDHFVVDLIYNPEETRLLREAKSNGAMVLNGTDMLHFQADEAWKIWNG